MITFPTLTADLSPTERRAAVRAYMDACRARLTDERRAVIRERISDLLCRSAWLHARSVRGMSVPIEPPRQSRHISGIEHHPQFVSRVRQAHPPVVETPPVAKRVANLTPPPAPPSPRNPKRRTNGRLLPLPSWKDTVLEFLRERGRASCREIAENLGADYANTNRGVNIMLDHCVLVHVGNDASFADGRGVMHFGAKLYAVANQVNTCE